MLHLRTARMSTKQLGYWTNRWRNLLPPLLVALGCLVVLVGIYRRPVLIEHDVGSTEVSLPGLYAPEGNDRFSYAYMQGTVPLTLTTLTNVGVGTFHTSLRLGGPNASRPVDVSLITPGQHVHLAAVQHVRVYHVLFPSGSDGAFSVHIASTTTQSGSDTRQLGALLDWIHIQSVGTFAPPISVLLPVHGTLLIVWLITGQIKALPALKLAFFACCAVVLCLGVGQRWGESVLEPGWFVNFTVYSGALALAIRAFIDPQWRRALRPTRSIKVPLLLFAITRLGIILVIYIAAPLIIDPADRPYTRPDNVVLDVLAGRWDAGFPSAIVKQGYSYHHTALPTVAFFPLLPLLIGIVMPITRDAMVAGVVIANLALLGATLLFYRLVKTEWETVIAERSLWYLLIFPMSFYGSASYSESLLLLGAIGALYYARRGSWKWAGIMGSMAALARPTGVLVAPMLLIEWLTQRRRPSPATRPTLAALLAPMMVVLGLGMYMLYLQIAFGDPLAFIHAQSNWGRSNSPLAMFSELVQQPIDGWRAALLKGHVDLNDWIDFLSVTLFAVLATVLLRQKRWAEGTFMMLNILVDLNAGMWMAQRRHMWILFPGFVLLARWGERPWVDRVITTLFLLGLGLFTAMYANWYWVA